MAGANIVRELGYCGDECSNCPRYLATLADDAEGGIADPSAIPILEHLDLALDGQVLDALARRWLSERGQTWREGQRKTDEPWWPPRQPLDWEEVFEVLRQENLHSSKGCYSAFDLYFVEPGDDSGEVIARRQLHLPSDDNYTSPRKTRPELS